MRGRGLSSGQMSQMYQLRNSTASGPPRQNAWNDFQHSMRGQGLSGSQMSEMYQQCASICPSGGTSVSANSGGLGWNAFQHSVGGQGYTKAEISEMYHAQK